MFGDAIYSILSNDATVSGYVSTRIYPLRIPQAASLPAITYFIVSDSPFNTKDGAVTDNYYRFQVSIFVDARASGAYDTIEDIDAAVRSALERYSGTVASTEVHTIEYLSMADLFEEDAQVFHRAVDFRVWIK